MKTQGVTHRCRPIRPKHCGSVATELEARKYLLARWCRLVCVEGALVRVEAG